MQHVARVAYVAASSTSHVAAVVDGSLRAPWKWEALIVESSVIGGDPQRWRRRLDGLDSEYLAQDPARSERGSRELAPRAPRARPGRSAASARVRAADHRRDGVLARRRDVGGVAGPVRGAGAADPASSRTRAPVIAAAAADERHRAGLARRSARRHLRPAAAARAGAAEVALRTRVRRRAAPGARPDVPRRLRARSRGADVSAEAARGPDDARRRDARAARRRSGDAGGSRPGRASPAAAGRGRRDRAALAVVSERRDCRIAAPRAVVLRARHRPRDHRAHPEP